MSNLDRCMSDKHETLFVTHIITDKTFKAKIINLNSINNLMGKEVN